MYCFGISERKIINKARHIVYCENCGAAANPAANFCRKCGRQLQVSLFESAPAQIEALASPQAPSTEVAIPSEDLAGRYVTEEVQSATAEKSAKTVEPKAVGGGPHHPWRRLFARMVDMVLATPLLYLLLFYPIGEYPLVEYLLGTTQAAIVRQQPYEIGVLIFLLWVPIEAAFLSAFGATFGKWAFGLQVLGLDCGRRLSYGNALIRAIYVLVAGMGVGIPIVNLIATLFSYHKLKTTGVTVWDENKYSVSCQSWTPVRGGVCAFSVLLALLGTALTPVIVAKNNIQYWNGRADLSPSAGWFSRKHEQILEPEVSAPKEEIDGRRQNAISDNTTKGSYAKNEFYKIEKRPNAVRSNKEEPTSTEIMKLTAAHPDWLDIIKTEQFKYWRDIVIDDGKALMESENADFIAWHLTQFKAWRRNQGR